MKRQSAYDPRCLPTPARRVIVLANRAPFKHQHTGDGRIAITRSASGVVTALEPIVEACAGTWVAYAAGDADVDDPVRAPEQSDAREGAPSRRYRLRYVSLDAEEYDGYYYGFANEGLWPLCHAVPIQPVFRPDDYRLYRAANRRFAAAVVRESAGSPPLVLVQDYHFALAPRLLRRRLSSDSVITSFWHIPWPAAPVLRKCPWAADLIDGLLGSDVLGFQTQGDRDNFFDGVADLVDARIRYSDDAVIYRNRSTRVRVYPVGVDWNNETLRAMPAIASCRDQVRRQYGIPDSATLGIGIDRLDYTKGIHEKFLAIERLLERRPDIRRHFTFMQVAEPSRERLDQYRNTRDQIEETVQRINARFGTSENQPIRLLDRHHESTEVYRLYRAADFCYVGSLHDGMNLVAKEFVCARTDHRGVLVLSHFAGAARQLRAAVLVDPYAIEETARALSRALAMPVPEQAHRMRLLRASVMQFDARWWRRQLFADALTASSNEVRDREAARPPADFISMTT